MSKAFETWAIPAGILPSLASVEEGAVRHPVLRPDQTRALISALRDAGSEVFPGRGAAARARSLGRAGSRFLDTGDPLRREAEALLPESAELSSAMARAVIDGMARDWTAERLLGLLAAELPHPDALDRFVPGHAGVRVRAFAPALSLHMGAGTVPGVAATSMLRALLVGSAAVVKPGRGDVVLPVLLARALAEEDSALARAAAVLYWGGGRDSAAEDVLLRGADLVIVYGGDDTVHAVRERLPITTRLVAYHHRVSVALVGRTALTRETMPAAAEATARAVAMFDQRGCVSPHAVFVEEGGEAGPREFARMLAQGLDALSHSLPATAPPAGVASAVQQLRRTTELRAAAGEDVELHASPDTSWTVLFDPLPALEASCLGRSVRVHAVADAGELPALLAPLGKHLQTVGVAGLADRLDRVATELGRVGVMRVCALAEVAFPPAWWHHDGEGPLRALLRWVDLEG